MREESQVVAPAWQRWLPFGRPHPDALTLLCLPFAGGSCAAYRTWGRHLTRDIAVCPVELPGRGTRRNEPAATRMSSLTRAMATELAPLAARPYAVFGHSLGGLIAFELVRRLEWLGLPPPVRLVVSAATPPGITTGRPSMRDAGEHELRAELEHLGGTPPELLRDTALMQMLAPTLRADFSVLETYAPHPGHRVAAPLAVIGGREDRVVPPEVLAGWQTRTTAGMNLRVFPGDHFYVQSEERTVLAWLANELLSNVREMVVNPA